MKLLNTLKRLNQITPTRAAANKNLFIAISNKIKNLNKKINSSTYPGLEIDISSTV